MKNIFFKDKICLIRKTQVSTGLDKTKPYINFPIKHSNKYSEIHISSYFYANFRYILSAPLYSNIELQRCRHTHTIYCANYICNRQKSRHCPYSQYLYRRTPVKPLENLYQTKPFI